MVTSDEDKAQRYEDIVFLFFKMEMNTDAIAELLEISIEYVAHVIVTELTSIKEAKEYGNPWI